MNLSGTVFMILLFLSTATAQETTLKDAFKNSFYIGTALNRGQIYGKDECVNKLLATQFNSITPENILKWEKVHPKPEEYNFEPVDKLMELAETNHMVLIGHVLVWHSQTPGWVFEDEPGQLTNRETLLKRMQAHIATVAGRCKGRIHGWDVVNEAFEDNGDLRKSKWLKIIGEDYIQKAFEFAREADPEAELYYNDYNMWKPGKVRAVVQMVRDLKEKGVKVDGIGMQGHWGLDYPKNLEEVDAAIAAFAGVGCKVVITEMDLNMLPLPDRNTGADISRNIKAGKELNPYPECLPDSMVNVQNERYAAFFKIFHKHRDAITRVTFWGVSDRNSWLNNWPVFGRTNYPLLFDRQCQPKPVFKAVIETAKE